MSRPFGLGNKRASKLTGEQVYLIRWRYFKEAGWSQAALAHEFGVVPNTIASIVNGLTWQRMAGWELCFGDKPPPNAAPPALMSEEEKAASIARLDELLNTPAKIEPRPDPVEEYMRRKPFEKQTSEALDELIKPTDDKGDQRD